ncbi:GerAB/ArcD/ProY family transporter [Paenibacillaceae bacterium WGS1546]|uniref:GerAB/ArcD/ProY family transporter n=1 Tax=Cohnella sp. WGS1546 TaxID=3366810 RepID=UPI00372D437F
MIAGKERITPGQLMILIIQSQIGIGVLFLPSEVEAAVGNDAWISVILTGLAASLFILAIWALGRRFPNQTLFEYLPRLLGKAAGKTVILFYAAMFILEGSLLLIQFADVIKDWVFADTPVWVIILLSLATSYYMAKESLRTISRYLVLTFGLIFVLIFISLYAYRNVEILYILPVNQAGIPKILSGTVKTIDAYYGFEVLLIAYPFVQGRGKDILKAAMWGNAFSILVYTFLVFTCLIAFTSDELKMIPQPVLYMVKSLSFTIFERADLYFLMIWIVVVLTTAVVYLFTAAKAAAALFGIRKHVKALPWVTLAFLGLTLIPLDQDTIIMIRNAASVLTAAMVLAIPPLLLAVSYMANIKEKGRAEG